MWITVNILHAQKANQIKAGNKVSRGSVVANQIIIFKCLHSVVIDNLFQL